MKALLWMLMAVAISMAWGSAVSLLVRPRDRFFLFFVAAGSTIIGILVCDMYWYNFK